MTYQSTYLRHFIGPCMNGATCLDDVDSFKCLCVRGFDGELCEIEIDECQSNPCQNGAICSNYVNSYSCTCAVSLIFCFSRCNMGLFSNRSLCL